MLASPYINIYSVITATIHLNKLSIPIRISETEKRTVETLGLIDSGAGGNFIDQNYIKKIGFETHLGNAHSSLQCGRNQEQMRNNQILCQHRLGNQRKKNKHSISCNHFRKRANHSQIPLAKRTQPRHQLEIRRNFLETTEKETYHQTIIKEETCNYLRRRR